ncbi:hypothetical protein JXJ21_04710 [candidate division KSB1 bacterium]|nr:hypothetical protein [candidate division KSB1 bacterium]
MSHSKESQRLALAVYLFLAALAIVFALLGIFVFKADSPACNLILNIATEIAGVVLIFFIVNKLFLLDKERDLVKQLESIKRGIHSRFSPIAWENRKYGLFDFERHLFVAQSVYLMGYNLASLIKEYRLQIREALLKGVRIQILIVDLESNAANLITEASSSKTWVKSDGEKSLKYIGYIKEALLQAGGKGELLEVRLMSWIPNCSMIIVNKSDDTGIAKIALHHPSINLPLEPRYREELTLLLNTEEQSREFNYFKKNFEILWYETFTHPIAE